MTKKKTNTLTLALTGDDLLNISSALHYASLSSIRDGDWINILSAAFGVKTGVSTPSPRVILQVVDLLITVGSPPTVPQVRKAFHYYLKLLRLIEDVSPFSKSDFIYVTKFCNQDIDMSDIREIQRNRYQSIKNLYPVPQRIATPVFREAFIINERGTDNITGLRNLNYTYHLLLQMLDILAEEKDGSLSA